MCYLIHPWEEDQVSAVWSRPEEWAMHYGWYYNQPNKTGQRLLLENHKRLMDLITKRNLLIEQALAELKTDLETYVEKHQLHIFPPSGKNKPWTVRKEDSNQNVVVQRRSTTLNTAIMECVKELDGTGR